MSIELNVTLAIFTYNHENFIGEALAGALAQSYSPLEIVIFDDASDDRTVEVIRSIVSNYVGQHTIQIFVNEKNIGLGATINRAMDVIHGQFIVPAAGDDVSLPERVSTLVHAYEEFGRNAFSLFSNCHVIDEDGNVERLYYSTPPAKRMENLAPRVKKGFVPLGATHAWDRRVFEFFGPIPEGVNHEDWIIPYRSALLGQIAYIDEPLVLYRRHSNNMGLRDADYLNNKQLWYDVLRKRTKYEIQNLSGRLVDLSKFEHVLPERNIEIGHLTKDTQALLRYTKHMQRMLDNAPLYTKIITTFTLIYERTPPKQMFTWIMTLFFPEIYLRKARTNVQQSLLSQTIVNE